MLNVQVGRPNKKLRIVCGVCDLLLNIDHLSQGQRGAQCSISTFKWGHVSKKIADRVRSVRPVIEHRTFASAKEIFRHLRQFHFKDSLFFSFELLALLFYHVGYYLIYGQCHAFRRKIIEINKAKCFSFPFIIVHGHLFFIKIKDLIS
jgi:hypothetical protein